MKKEELKRDPVASKIIKSVRYLQHNKFVVVVIFLILYAINSLIINIL